MADQLQSNDHMMSGSGIRPWHGIGTIVEGLATAAEAMEAAKLGWKVNSQNTAWLNDEGEIGGIIPGEITNVRSDDNTVLGIVGDGYHILQNDEAFAFFDSVAEKGEAIYETAGSLYGGRVVFLTAKIPDLIRVGTGDDVVENYLLLANSHDGSGAVKVKLVNTRVVCNNTLTMALRETGSAFSIRHTQKLAEKIGKAHEAMGIANKRILKLSELYNEMAKFDLSDLDAKLFFERVFEDKPKRGMKLITPSQASLIEAADKEEKEKNKRSIDQIGQIFVNDGNNVPGQDGKSLWHAVNAVTYWTNHGRTYKEHAASTNTREDNKAHSLLFGQSADLGSKSLVIAQEMLKEGPSARPVVGVGVDFKADDNAAGVAADDTTIADTVETNTVADSEVDVKPVAKAKPVVKKLKSDDPKVVKTKADAKPAKAKKAKTEAKADADAKLEVAIA